MAISDITSITFIEGIAGSLQGAVGYPTVDANNGITGFNLTPTANRIEVSSDGAITGIGSSGELATLVSETDLGWNGIAIGA